MPFLPIFRSRFCRRCQMLETSVLAFLSHPQAVAASCPRGIRTRAKKKNTADQLTLKVCKRPFICHPPCYHNPTSAPQEVHVDLTVLGCLYVSTKWPRNYADAVEIQDSFKVELEGCQPGPLHTPPHLPHSSTSSTGRVASCIRACDG